MKETKEIKKNKPEKEENIIKILSNEDAIEFKEIATGRKFCKVGERVIDICNEEIKRYNYDNSKNIFLKIFKCHKFKKTEEKLMIENRASSNIRAIVKYCIDKDNENIENVIKLVAEVRNIILENVKQYEKSNKV